MPSPATSSFRQKSTHKTAQSLGSQSLECVGLPFGVQIKNEPHPYFTRDEADLLCTQNITLMEVLTRSSAPHPLMPPNRES